MVGTGLNDRSTISKVYKWNGLSSLPVDWWSSDWARMINGTDAQLFPPSLSTKKDLFIFIGLLKRVVALAGDLPLGCAQLSAFKGCLPTGLMDISRTLPGKVRVYVSGSHFLNSPAVLYQNFSGFGTPSTDDETFIDIEPVSVCSMI
ncbi:unnamed protein product [Anisakis simplex]|uniref:Uncharacterized protein n=1 Tax=Anisakis simplex TaxID=6269 RepID=A0A3P6S2M6_ANISI|nr:unnamed protein product [Anisakis simplex]